MSKFYGESEEMRDTFKQAQKNAPVHNIHR